jgi:hypothetical protein
LRVRPPRAGALGGRGAVGQVRGAIINRGAASARDATHALPRPTDWTFPTQPRTTSVRFQQLDGGRRAANPARDSSHDGRHRQGSRRRCTRAVRMAGRSGLQQSCRGHCMSNLSRLSFEMHGNANSSPARANGARLHDLGSCRHDSGGCTTIVSRRRVRRSLRILGVTRAFNPPEPARHVTAHYCHVVWRRRPARCCPLAGVQRCRVHTPTLAPAGAAVAQP